MSEQLPLLLVAGNNLRRLPHNSVFSIRQPDSYQSRKGPRAGFHENDGLICR